MRTPRALALAAAVTVAAAVPAASTAEAHSDCAVGIYRRNAAGAPLSTWSLCQWTNPYRYHRPVIWCQNAYGTVIVDYGTWTPRGSYGYGAACPFAFWGVAYGHQHTS